MAEATEANVEDEEKTTSGLKNTAIFRVKRKLTDDPVEALLVAHEIKRKRTAERNDALESKTTEDKPVEILFKLAGTVQKEDDSLVKMTLINHKLAKPNPYNTSTQEVDRIRELSRNQSMANRKTNRLKVVSSHRSTEESKSSLDDEAKDESSGNKELFHLYDVVHDDKEAVKADTRSRNLKGKCADSNEPEDNAIVCNSVRMVRERCTLAEGMSNLTVNEEEFVYDIYYCEEVAGPLGHILNIKAIEQEYVHEEEEEDLYEDEDDSNDESNWRNDYPDEDEVYFDEDGEGHVGITLSSDEDDCQGWRRGTRSKFHNDDIYDSEISDPEHWSD